MFDATSYMIKGIHPTFNNLHFMLSSLIKAMDWEYEKEWRLIFAHGIIPSETSYTIGKPKAIYMGSRITPKDQKSLIEICEAKGIPYFKMKIHRDKFKLEAVDVKDADPAFFRSPKVS